MRTFPFRVYSFPKEIIGPSINRLTWAGLRIAPYPGRLCTPRDPIAVYGSSVDGLHLQLFGASIGGEFVKFSGEMSVDEAKRRFPLIHFPELFRRRDPLEVYLRRGTEYFKAGLKPSRP